MNISCSHRPFQKLVAACAAVGRSLSDDHEVILVAREGSPGSPGCLDVLVGRQTLSASGVIACLPAQVTCAGQVTVSLKWPARSLSLFRAKQVHLSRVDVPPGPVLEKTSLTFRAFSGPALQIEECFSSRTSRQSSRQRVRLRLLPDQERAGPDQPAFASWQTTGISLGQVGSADLCRALAPCLDLAREGAQMTTQDAAMNHGQVLCRFEPDALTFTGTTRWEVVSQRLPLSTWGQPASCSHALFDEPPMRGIVRALARWKKPLTLRLILLPHKQEVLLLVSQTEDGPTLFCRGTTVSIPLVWEKIWKYPVQTSVLVPRLPLARALRALSASLTVKEMTQHYLVLQVYQNILHLQRKEQNQGEEPSLLCRVHIPLDNETEDLAPCLVALHQLNRSIQFLTGSLARLEVGQPGGWKRATPENSQAPTPVPFLRVSDSADSGPCFLFSLLTVRPLPSAATKQTDQPSQDLAPV